MLSLRPRSVRLNLTPLCRLDRKKPYGEASKDLPNNAAAGIIDPQIVARRETAN